MMHKVAMALVVCLSALVACGPSAEYEANFDFEGQNWSPDAQPTFSFSVEEPQAEYDIFYHIRHSRDYPYQNLYVQLFIEDSARNVLKSELQNISLFDPKTGQPEGSGVGATLTREIRGTKNFVFPGPGTYTVRLEQRNRTEEAPSISSFGIRVFKSQSE